MLAPGFGSLRCRDVLARTPPVISHAAPFPLAFSYATDDWDAVSLDFKRKFDEHVIRLVAAEAMLRFLNPGDMTPRAADTPPAADDFDFT